MGNGKPTKPLNEPKKWYTTTEADSTGDNTQDLRMRIAHSYALTCRYLHGHGGGSNGYEPPTKPCITANTSVMLILRSGVAGSRSVRAFSGAPGKLLNLFRTATASLTMSTDPLGGPHGVVWQSFTTSPQRLVVIAKDDE